MKWMARFGYMARGVVYCAMAYFAMLAALGLGATQDAHGAIARLAHVPHGRIWLVVIIVGLAAFATWRVAQCLADVDGHGSSAKAWIIRLGLLLSAAIYGALALWAARFFGEDAGTPSSTVAWTARLLSQPGGRIAVAAIAAGLIGVGAAHFFKAATCRFLRYLEPGARAIWIQRVSQAGLVARGILFLLFAYFAVRVAWTLDATQAKDMAHVLRWLQSVPGARAWMGLVAAGLGAFGA